MRSASTGTLPGVTASAIVPALLGLRQPEAMLHVLILMKGALAFPSLIRLQWRVPEPLRRLPDSSEHRGAVLRTLVAA